MSYTELYFMGKFYGGVVALGLFALLGVAYIVASFIDWLEARRLKKAANRFLGSVKK